MEKMNGQSLDIVQDNVQYIKQRFPDVFTEGKIDFDKLRLVLGDNIEENDERYQFTWNGKTEAIKNAQTPSMGTLRPDKESSKNWDNTENLYIEGDNLEVLKLLQKSYFGKVKMIYIDPPYNTGNDFVYKDNFRDSISNYKEITNQTTKANAETSGRYHTDWLNMMYPRLKLARNLLREDGVIFISIDDNESHNLRKICDEIFGEDNFICEFIWRRRTGSNDAKNLVSVDHETVLCFAKSSILKFKGIKKDFTKYTNPDNDPRGEWMPDNLTCNKTASERPNLYYEITDPKTNITYKCNPNRVWAYEINRMEKMIKQEKIIFPVDGKGTPKYKRHKAELKSDTKPFTSILDVAINAQATKELRDVLDGQIFDFPKGVDLLKLLANQIVDDTDIILDFFSGSSTTAHAVMQLNAEDNGNRKFIMVQLPEVTDEKSEAYKVGYSNICEIGKERIRRAGDKIVSESGKTDLDIGFKVFKLDDSNIKEWSPNYNELEVTLDEMTDNLKVGRTKEDLLFEILIKMGIELTAPIEEINIGDKKIYNIGMGSLVICLEDEITEDIINEIPKYKSDFVDMKVVFKETGFRTDSQKMNAIQNLKQFGINDVRSI